MAIYFAQNKSKLFLGPQKVRQGYVADRKVYSSANTVTYMVDTGISYTEEADSGTSCLSPKTFTPQKTGWSFVGWREDRTAGAGVLESKVMADSPVTLYAVFRAGVTVTYYNNSTSASSTSGYRYYNNGSVVNPSFQLTQTSSSGWTARGWSTSNQGNAGITYANGAVFTRDSNVTLYGLYQQSITVTYYNNSTSASRTTGTRYWAPAGYINPSFQLTQASSGGWTARGWSTGTAGNSGITYNNGAAFIRDSNITLYGMYQQTITLSYNGNGASGGSTAAQSGTRYYNSNGATVNPGFALRANGFSRGGYTFTRWALGDAGGTQYAAGAGVTLSASTVMYAVWVATAVAFGYTGGMQSYRVPVAGTYKLEVYGAAGGNCVGAGGKGGYAYGNVSLQEGTVLYVGVGGKGADAPSTPENTTVVYGGYNGGGNGKSDVVIANGRFYDNAAGGGATHIGKTNTVLANTSVSNLLIAAGGGGGGGYDKDFTTIVVSAGGAGGGLAGGKGENEHYGGAGGTQTTGNAYGTGGEKGGGGGYYGGRGTYYYGGGGGGSAYIGGVSGGMTSSGQRQGNGYAAITLISAG